jgi:mono/diheme cytochrome c family protein
LTDPSIYRRFFVKNWLFSGLCKNEPQNFVFTPVHYPMSSLRFLPLLLAFLPTSLFAKDDGEKLYTQFCSACHGVDGKGANNGAFPPLAGSLWVEGTQKRSIAIVLNGLHGPIEVKGKTYDLAMPPQGAALSDEQIISILNYVHTAWGNKGQIIPRDLIRVTRSEFDKRTEHWTAPELLKLCPLPIQNTALSDLTSRVYKGQWNQIPDFDKIQAENIEEEHHGKISPSIAGMDIHFGIVWEGNFVAPEAGEYEFVLDSDDGSRLILNGKVVSEVNGTGAMNGKRVSTGKISLKKGKNPFRMDFFQNKGPAGISLKWRKSGDKAWNWLTKSTTTSEKAGPPSIPLFPSDGKTVIYRNFIEGTTARGIGFGFPGGLNLVYSADNLAPELVWLGNFMDAGRHWTNRGQGNQPPSSTNVIKLTKDRFLPKDARFKGYSLDPKGNPTFKVQIGDQLLTDSWKAIDQTLVRTLTLDGGTNLEIPLGNAEVTGAESTTVTPGKPITINYLLK